MVRFLCVQVLATAIVAMFTIAAEPTADDLKKKPITPVKGELGDLLRKWYKDGTAAGNVGDWYDNRDRTHSELNRVNYPQLQKHVYSADELKVRADWAWQLKTLPKVVVGNSSTSGPPQFNGSNPRSSYVIPAVMKILEKQYTSNNLYIYPEHRDHDPGHNGVGDGYGDLYPTNTPYLLISQGSSGSDQPFMQAIPYTLAAFRPDVKKKLIEAGLLMPTVQMIMRSTMKNIKSPKEYLTGKAHPTVFEGSNVDPLKMVKLAHEITLKNIPPLIKLKVLKEDKPVAGQDFFDAPNATEHLADTVSVIARIWRGQQHKRRLVVSVADSVDVNKNPLTFTWVVLRGDPKRITIKPNKKGTEAEITVAYHERRPIEPGSAMQSNRVDIGVFANNGTYYSTPGFVTLFTLDHESRTYDARGQIIEIGHGMGETELFINDHVELLRLLSNDGPAAKTLKITKEQQKILADILAGAKKQIDARKTLQDERAKLEMARLTIQQKLMKLGKDDKNRPETQKQLTEAAKQVQAQDRKIIEATQALHKAIVSKAVGKEGTVGVFVQAKIQSACSDLSLWNTGLYTEYVKSKRKGTIDAARRKLESLGIAATGMGKLKLTLLGKEPTNYEATLLKQFHATGLCELLLPGVVTARWHQNFVDLRLSIPKSWRDVYHYDTDKLIGWTRYHEGKKIEFTADGLKIIKTDAKGRPVEARTVMYAIDTGTTLANRKPLVMKDGDEVVTFSYDGNKVTRTRKKVSE